MARNYTPAEIAARERYNDKNFDRVYFRVPKGARDNLKRIAGELGKSLNQFIVDAIRAELARNHNAGKVL